jgi:hypothetical protein
MHIGSVRVVNWKICSALDLGDPNHQLSFVHRNQKNHTASQLDVVHFSKNSNRFFEKFRKKIYYQKKIEQFFSKKYIFEKFRFFFEKDNV